MKASYLLALTIVWLSGCATDEASDLIIVDLDSFEHITTAYPYADIDLSGSAAYWDLNLADGETSQIVYANGNLCEGVPDSAVCVANFNATDIPSTGFAPGCLPANCYHYIRSNINSFNRIYDSPNDVSGFLGFINSPGEAILLTFANGYYFSTVDKSIGAVKEADDGYELLLLALVSDCTPVQTNRFHLRVTRSGNIKILGVEVYEEEEDACI